MIDNIGLNDKLTINVVRDGEVIKTVTPVSDSGFLGKIMHIFGLKDFTTDLITTAGIDSITTHIAADYTHVAYGTGTSSPTRADTALETEVDRVAAVVSQATTTLANDTVNFVATFDIAGTYAITEAGIFDASTGGTMTARQTFSAINLIANDQLVFNWDIVLS